MKIFITAVDSELGYHLVETLRQDHLSLQGYPQISGTSSSNQPFQLHTSVERCFDFTKERDQAVKNAIDSDVLIVDLRYDIPFQVQFILKVLKHYNRTNTMKIIGISNFMTWSNAKQSQFIYSPHDKQDLFDCTLNKEKWAISESKRQNYPLRTAHPLFVYNYLLEQQIMQLKYHQTLIKPIILCTGVLYGKSGMDLSDQIQRSVLCKSSELISIGNNFIRDNQKIPLLHIDKLLSKIQDIVYDQSRQKQIMCQQYLVLCENQPKSIPKIILTLHELCGHRQILCSNEEQNHSQSNQKTLIPEITLSNNKRLFSLLFNFSFAKSQNLQQIEEKSSIQEKDLCKRILEQFIEYHQVQFKHFIISEQLVIQYLHNEEITDSQTETTGKSNHKSFINKLLTIYSVLDKQKANIILQKLIENGQIPQQRLSTPQQEKKKPKTNVPSNQKKQTIKKQPYEIFLPQIIKRFITENKNSNFLIHLSQQLILQFFTFFGQSEFNDLKDIKFILLTKTEHEQGNQSYQKFRQNIEKKVQLFSNEFFDQVGISSTDQTSDDKVESEMKQSPQQVLKYEKTNPKATDSLYNSASGSEQSRINLAEQYLLDNLIVYLAEAKQKLLKKGIMKKGQKFEGKQNIKLFIQELKQVRKRQELLWKSEEDQEKDS